MVFLTRIVLYASERKLPRRFKRGLFVDSLRLHVRAGAGGNGLPKYGGIGGKGGDIYVEATDGLTLERLLKMHPEKRFVSDFGENSQQQRILGVPGKDKIITVPLGVTVYDEYGRCLGEVNSEGNRVLVAKGGVGGCPSTQFLGRRGQSHSIVLDLKLIADTGLVGFPNAGKSTLLKAISSARPKIASYPFTTIRPNIGVLSYPDHRQITMADLPGLIEGAHANIGLGHSFLKHVERTKLLLLVVDIQGFQLSAKHKHRSSLETVLLLNREIELYREDLLDKPALIAVNKLDIEGTKHMWDELREKLKHLKDVVRDFPDDLRPVRPLEFWDILPISAESDPNSIQRLKEQLRNVLDIIAEQSTNDKEEQLLQKLHPRMIQSGPNVV